MGQHGRGVRWWAAGAIFGLAGAVISAARCGTDCASNASYALDYIDTSTLDSWRRLSFSGSQTLDSRNHGCSPRQLPNTTKKRCGTNTILPALLIVLFVNVRGAAQVPTATPSPVDRESLLIDRIEKLERRLAELEAQNSQAFSRKNKTRRPWGWCGGWKERRAHGNSRGPGKREKHFRTAETFW